MFRQNTSNTFMQVSLVFLLSLCSLSAFSDGYKHITILQKVQPDMDTYTVTAIPQEQKCVVGVSPQSLKTVPESSGQSMEITYLKTVHGCGVLSSKQLFVVRGVNHRDRVAIFRWIKRIGRAPRVEYDKGMDPRGLTSIDDSDPDNIKVSISYNEESQKEPG